MSRLSVRPARFARPSVEQLEDRVTPAVTATFVAGVLVVVGDAADNNIVVSAADNGALQVTEDGATVPIRAFFRRPVLANTALVVVFGQGGDDAIAADPSLGTVPAAFYGGPGNDTLLAGHQGNSLLSGDGGNDTLQGGGGHDALFGGAGVDDLRGGEGHDLLSGGADDDALNGEGGRDLLLGGFGDDKLDGGQDGAVDVLVGGPGADAFFIFDGEDDVLADFNPDEGDEVFLPS